MYDRYMSARIRVFTSVAGLLGVVLIQYSSPVHAQSRAELKHVRVTPVRGIRGGATIAGLSIERGAKYPSVVHARGNVEIRTNGYVLNADAADYNEDTGVVEAHGDVRVKPYPALPSR
jgi:lipopolysaccharide assembly outer membrane protein LptD (OstA)